MPYRITVDLTNQIVTIYSNEDGSIVRQMLCSAGVQDSTPQGTFYMEPNMKDKDDRKDWYHFKGFGVYAAFA
ncbi:MAG: L,D-transpeptidase, partial [Clostridiales bacterium]|nr:L,D-transpeptidase [Clostridiales bacterium]